MTESQARSSSAALRTLITAVADHGEYVDGGTGLSVGHGRRTLELINHSVTITEPTVRLPVSLNGTFRLSTAIARFTWMMAGNDRLADIAFYEPAVGRFTDDGVTVPGSSFGRRLRDSQPGLDQLVGLIEELRVNPTSRRAVASIFLPIDAVRRSRDIPCLLGLAYHVRGEGLHATNIMRSNNVLTLAPYNIFELSMLAEVVASELGLPLKRLTHTCLSAHIYEDELDTALAFASSQQDYAWQAFPPMPHDPSPLKQIAILVGLEVQLRLLNPTEANVLELYQKAADNLHPYWLDLYLVLMSTVLTRRYQKDELSRRVRQGLSERALNVLAAEGV